MELASDRWSFFACTGRIVATDLSQLETSEQPVRNDELPRRFRDALLMLLVGLINGAGPESALRGFSSRLEKDLPDGRVVVSFEGAVARDLAPEGLFQCREECGCLLRTPAANAACSWCQDCMRSDYGRAVCMIGKAVLVLDVALPVDSTLIADLDVVAKTARSALDLYGFGSTSVRGTASEAEALTRELHDSVAQQLGFMSFLIGRLQQRIKSPEPLLVELRTMMTKLQHQVRELITSARLTLNGRSLRQALADSVAEFSRRCDVAFEMDNRLPDIRLDPDVELHILQIVREALSNLVRHAQAQQAWIALLPDGRGGLRVSVTDDGVGLRPGSIDENHHGLDILRERAQAIGARISIENGAQRGVCVNLVVPSDVIKREIL